jgi:hypothetical protein
LDCAHLIRRGVAVTRTVVENGVCLCRSCHQWAHHNPAAFTEWVEATWPGRLERLRGMAASLERVDWRERAAELRAEAKQKGVL